MPLYSDDNNGMFLTRGRGILWQHDWHQGEVFRKRPFYGRSIALISL